MATEIELRILNINVEEIKQKLELLGAEKVGEAQQRRYVYDFTPKKENSWVRLRTNGKKTTLTIKEINNDTIDGTEELEVEVSDFDETNSILAKLGYSPRNYQENNRISYKLDGVDIEIDSWPLIPTYLEVEGSSIEEVEAIVKKLGFTMEQTTAINTIKIYKQYGIDLDSIKELKF